MLQSWPSLLLLLLMMEFDVGGGGVVEGRLLPLGYAGRCGHDDGVDDVDNFNLVGSRCRWWKLISMLAG